VKTNLFAGIWAFLTTVIFVAGFFSQKAASMEPFGRYIYMTALFVCLIAVTIMLMKRRYNEGNDGKI
jgi:hypothetical protein